MAGELAGKVAIVTGGARGIGVEEEGIELAKLYDYDLILLDLSLPDMDGYETTSELRLAEAGSSRTPVVAITARPTCALA